MELLADKSTQRFLWIAGGVLVLFAVYFLLAVLSNRSVRRLAETLRRRRGQARPQVVIQPASRFFSLPWAILVLVAAAAGLIAMLIYTTTILRQ